MFAMTLTKAQILAGLSERITTEMYVAALGGDVRIHELTRAQYRAAAEQGKDADHPTLIKNDLWHIAVIAAGVIDAQGKPLFSFDELYPLAQGDDPPLRATAARELAQKILDLSEVGPTFLDAPSSALPATKA
jgi:hypothetical protein